MTSQSYRAVTVSVFNHIARWSPCQTAQWSPRKERIMAVKNEETNLRITVTVLILPLIERAEIETIFIEAAGSLMSLEFSHSNN